MAETTMNVKLLAHSQLEHTYLCDCIVENIDHDAEFTDGQAVALTAIRTCYSPGKPSEIVANEGAKYFGSQASDGGSGCDADRLMRHIVNSGHTSTLEHLTFTFAIEGVSRALLAQLTRHRVGFSFSVQSQRYVRLGSDDKSQGFDYVVPESIRNNERAYEVFRGMMKEAQDNYDDMRDLGVPPEDARAVLPNATATNLTMTANLRALLDFYAKRRKGRGAQAEITELAEALREKVTDVEPWTAQFFDAA